tara:strand:+ start:222 stop:452 length:231 start_codon:yes stop_codon:yes gene_type:complete
MTNIEKLKAEFEAAAAVALEAYKDADEASVIDPDLGLGDYFNDIAYVASIDKALAKEAYEDALMEEEAAAFAAAAS